jgi:chromosome segregation ATPase
MRDKISKQEKMLQKFEKQFAGQKTGNNVDDDQKKNDKLAKKYKDLKGKVRTLDLVLSENEKQKNDLRKHIEAKDELVKLKDIEIYDLDKKLNEQKSDTVSMSTLKNKIENLEEDLTTNEDELRHLQNKLKEDADFRAIKFKMMETTAKQNEHAIEQMKSRHKELVDQLKRKNTGLEEECEMLREMQSIIKTEKSSIGDLKEGFRLQFKETFASKDGKIKELEERNDFICKENEDLRVEMKKYVEDAPTKEGIISMMKESIKDKNKEISDLKSRWREPTFLFANKMKT